MHEIRPFGRDRSHAGRSLLFLEEVDSTNSYCLRHPELLGTPGLVVAARNQRAGRGSKGRSWLSGAGGHLFCSFVLHPELDTNILPCMSLFCGLAVRRALIALGLSQEKIRLKWPNDVMVARRKAAGILCELSWLGDGSSHGKRPVVVAGIGVNIKGGADQFPEEVRPFVTTLEEAGLETTSEILLEYISSSLDQLLGEIYETGPAHAFEEWNRHCLDRGARVVVHADGNSTEGRLLGLDDQGRLVIEPLSEAITGDGDIRQDGRMAFIGGTLRYIQ